MFVRSLVALVYLLRCISLSVTYREGSIYTTSAQARVEGVPTVPLKVSESISR